MATLKFLAFPFLSHTCHMHDRSTRCIRLLISLISDQDPSKSCVRALGLACGLEPNSLLHKALPAQSAVPSLPCRIFSASLASSPLSTLSSLPCLVSVHSLPSIYYSICSPYSLCRLYPVSLCSFLHPLYSASFLVSLSPYLCASLPLRLSGSSSSPRTFFCSCPLAIVMST